jgi:hypothetical protein
MQQLVMPPFMQIEPAIGVALCSARAILHGRGGDVWEMVNENFSSRGVIFPQWMRDAAVWHPLIDLPRNMSVWSSIAAMGWPRLLESRELSAVPIAWYFVVVGSALMVLLLIAGWSLPQHPEFLIGWRLSTGRPFGWDMRGNGRKGRPGYQSADDTATFHRGSAGQQSVARLPDEMRVARRDSWIGWHFTEANWSWKPHTDVIIPGGTNGR